VDYPDNVNVSSDMSDIAWTPVSASLPAEWVAWAAESLLHGNSDQQVYSMLAERGFNQTAITETLAAIRSEACYTVASRTIQRWKKLKSLMDIRRSLAGLSYTGGSVERRSGVSQAEFLERYYAVNRPLILTGLLGGSYALQNWTPHYLGQTCGDATVQVMFGRENDPNYEINSESHKIDMKFAEYANMVISGGETNDYYLVANNGFLDRPEAQTLNQQVPQFPEYLDGSASQRKVFLWFGPGGTVTPLHHDVMNILVAQIFGRKRFTLISPEQSPYVYNEIGVYSQVDCKNPDYARYPLYRYATPMDVTLEPGDVLFLPVGWWHHVESLDVSIMLSYTNFKFPNQYEWSNPDIRY
jgi:hypothetical protein